MFKVILRFSHIPQHIAIAMTILSPTIRRSLHQVLASSKKSFCKNNNVLSSSSSSSSLALGRVTATRSSSIISRRAIHSTSVVSGDALDMADTFSRRHRKLYLYQLFAHILCIIIFMVHVNIICMLYVLLSLYTTNM